MAPHIVHDRARCRGFLVCASADAERWVEHPGEDKVDLADAVPTPDGTYEREIMEEELDEVIVAAEGCPARVISVRDDDGRILAGPASNARPAHHPGA